MSEKHTPGPWTFHSWAAAGKQFGIETADHRHGIASIRPNDTASSLLSMEQHEANARLIAAAPDLLAALRSLYNDAHDRGETCNEQGEMYDDWKAAFAAIAKATA